MNTEQWHSKGGGAKDRKVSAAMEVLFFREARELYLGTSVPELCSAPSPLEFHRFVTFSPLLSKSVFLNLHHHLQIRDWVSPNLPVVIRGGASHFPAIDSWTPQLLRSRIGQAKVTVAVTPDGLADAPKVGVFFFPECLICILQDDSPSLSVFIAIKI